MQTIRDILALLRRHGGPGGFFYFQDVSLTGVGFISMIGAAGFNDTVATISAWVCVGGFLIGGLGALAYAATREDRNSW